MAAKKKRTFDSDRCAVCQLVLLGGAKNFESQKPLIAVGGVPVCGYAHFGLLRAQLIEGVHFDVRPLDSGGEAAQTLIQQILRGAF